MTEAAGAGHCERGPELSALLDGELGRVGHRRLRAHVRGCEDCAAELASLAGVRSQLRSLPPREVPEGLWQEAAARAGDGGARAHRRRAERRAVAALLVAVALTGALAWGVGDGQQRIATRPLEALVGGQGGEPESQMVHPLFYEPAE